MSNFKRIVKAQVKLWKFQDVISWNLTFIFLGSLKNFSLVLSQITNYYHIFALEKWKKRMQYAFNYSWQWYKVFVHWKLKLLNFLMDYVLTWFKGSGKWKTFITISLKWPLISYYRHKWSEDSCFKLPCVNIHFEMKDHCKAFFLKLCQLSALHLIIVLYWKVM